MYCNNDGIVSYLTVTIPWSIILAISLILKRYSLRPGGYLRLYDEHQIRTKMIHLRETLTDTFLVEHYRSKILESIGNDQDAAEERLRIWRKRSEKWEDRERNVELGRLDWSVEQLYRRNQGSNNNNAGGRVDIPSLHALTICIVIFLPFSIMATFVNSNTFFDDYYYSETPCSTYLLAYLNVAFVIIQVLDNRKIIRNFEKMIEEERQVHRPADDLASLVDSSEDPLIVDDSHESDGGGNGAVLGSVNVKENSRLNFPANIGMMLIDFLSPDKVRVIFMFIVVGSSIWTAVFLFLTVSMSVMGVFADVVL